MALTRTQIKITTLITMTINHIGHLFQFTGTIRFITDFIGMCTFPTLAYLLVEGFHLTDNQTNYLKRLTVWALISVIPFYYAFGNDSILNNVLWTLVFGLIVLQKKDLLWLLICIFLSSSSDWGVIGVLMIYMFSIMRHEIVILIMSAILTVFTKEYHYLGMLLTIPILYKHTRGENNRFVNKLFYVYYPLHLVVLVLIKNIINIQ